MGTTDNFFLSLVIDSISKEGVERNKLNNFDEFKTREEFVDSYYEEYYKDFISRIKKYGRTELNEKLIVHPWVEEYASIVGDLRTFSVSTTGCAQCGKTLLNTLFLIDFTLFSNLDSIWYYPTRTQRDSLVPSMYGRVSKNYISAIEKELGISLINNVKRNASRSIQQLREANIYFQYASTTAINTDAKRGLATVGASASSISGNLLFIEERSQIQPDAVSTLYRRLDAARLRQGLIREIGTPGNGNGIESAFESCDFHFYPHVVCDSCDSRIPLNPMGCLLLPEKGNFLSRVGRPINWHYSNIKNKRDSVYIACPHCKNPIDNETRQNAFFACLKTGKTYEKYQTDLAKRYKTKDYKIIVHLSPLLRNRDSEGLAKKILFTGLDSDSVKDFQQQSLGFPSQTEENRITNEMLKTAVSYNIPDKEKHTLIVAGIDQGRHEDWLVVYKVYMPKEFKIIGGIWVYDPEHGSQNTAIKLIELAKKKVIFMSAIDRQSIIPTLQRLNVDTCFMDNEPDIPDAHDMAQRFPTIELCDQKTSTSKLCTPIKIVGGSLEVDGWGIAEIFFKDCVFNSYALGNIDLLDIDVNDRSMYSPARHLSSCVKSDDNRGQWLRPKDKIDDLFFASMFAEAALYKWVDTCVENFKNSCHWYEDLYLYKNNFNQDPFY